MALTIDFANKIIKPDRADMTLIQSTPIEIYQFDLNTFHQGMRNLEDDEGGIWADVTHDYASPTTLSGVTYARLIEIINDYTVTFLPDSAWVVQIVGGNSNVSDRVNPNNVSVQASNSAGLQELTLMGDILDILENRLVTVDNGNGTGTMTLYADDAVTVLKSWTTVVEGSGAISTRTPV